MTADTPEPPRVQVVDVDAGPSMPLVANGGSARAVIWPGMGARLRSMHRISLAGEGSTIPLRHQSDAVYYVISGVGQVAGGDGAEAQELIEGSMVHVDAGTGYLLRAGPEGLEAVGGPAPADDALYEPAGEGA